MAQKAFRRVWLLGAVFSLALFGNQIHGAIDHADEHLTFFGLNRRPFYFALSTKCAVQRHINLVLEDAQHQLHPIEEIDTADDYGEAFLADIVARVTHHTFLPKDIYVLNIAVNVVGIAVIALILCWNQMYISSLACLWLGRLVIPGPYPSMDLTNAGAGIFCLAMVPAILLAFHWLVPKKGLRLFSETLIAMFCLTMAIFMRQQLGLVGIFSAALLLLRWMCSSPKKVSGSLHAIGFFVMSWISLNIPSWILRSRDRSASLISDTYMKAHGIWHSLYLGLGVVPNSWGIQWDDHYGIDLIRRFKLPITYCSPEYFNFMKKLYWNAVRTKPKEVLHIYMAKIGMAFGVSLRVLGINVFVWTLLLLAFLPIVFRTTSSNPIRRSAEISWVLVSGAFFIFLEGLLTITNPIYLYPAQFAVALALCCFSDAILKRD